MTLRALLVLTLLLPAGCSFSSRGFDRGRLARTARVDRHAVSDADIAGAVALRPELGFPFRLGVWFRPPTPWQWSEHRFYWRDEDRETVLAALEPLVRAGIATDVFAIPDAVFPGEGVRAARYAAARHGADAVLVVTGASAFDRHSNAASLLYPTIVGLWVAPGSVAEAICLATGSLWDVRSGYLYAAVESQATATQSVPIMHVDVDAVLSQARTAALTSLAQDLQSRLGNLRQARTAAATTRR